MQNATTKFYSLDYTDVRTYLVSLLFVLGNMALPQLCHLIPQGGMMWLPIYFFTLIAAYKFGWRQACLPQCCLRLLIPYFSVCLCLRRFQPFC